MNVRVLDYDNNAVTMLVYGHGKATVKLLEGGEVLKSLAVALDGQRELKLRMKD